MTHPTFYLPLYVYVQYYLSDTKHTSGMGYKNKARCNYLHELQKVHVKVRTVDPVGNYNFPTLSTHTFG